MLTRAQAQLLADPQAAHVLQRRHHRPQDALVSMFRLRRCFNGRVKLASLDRLECATVLVLNVSTLAAVSAISLTASSYSSCSFLARFLSACLSPTTRPPPTHQSPKFDLSCQHTFLDGYRFRHFDLSTRCLRQQHTLCINYQFQPTAFCPASALFCPTNLTSTSFLSSSLV